MVGWMSPNNWLLLECWHRKRSLLNIKWNIWMLSLNFDWLLKLSERNNVRIENRRSHGTEHIMNLVRRRRRNPTYCWKMRRIATISGDFHYWSPIKFSWKGHNKNFVFIFGCSVLLRLLENFRWVVHPLASCSSLGGLEPGYLIPLDNIKKILDYLHVTGLKQKLSAVNGLHRFLTLCDIDSLYFCIWYLRRDIRISFIYIHFMKIWIDNLFVLFSLDESFLK